MVKQYTRIVITKSTASNKQVSNIKYRKRKRFEWPASTVNYNFVIYQRVDEDDTKTLWIGRRFSFTNKMQMYSYI